MSLCSYIMEAKAMLWQMISQGYKLQMMPREGDLKWQVGMSVCTLRMGIAVCMLCDGGGLFE